MKHEKMKAAVADVVVKRLNPYFRNKKITSKVRSLINGK